MTCPRLPSRRTLWAGACSALLLAGCVQPPVSEDAVPGAAPANPSTAGVLFAKGCLLSLPDFSGTPQAIASEPVTQRKASGVYYHNQQNLSLKIVRSSAGLQCSVVFGTPLSENDAVGAFTAAAQAAAPGINADVEVTVTPGPDGLTYYNARTNAQ